MGNAWVMLGLANSTQKAITVRIKFLRENMPDFEVIELWEHDWNKMCKDNKNVLEIIKDFP